MLVTQTNRRQAKKKQKALLRDALAILRIHQSRRASANKLLKAGHFFQLLIFLGQKKRAYETAGPRKGKVFKVTDLRKIY